MAGYIGNKSAVVSSGAERKKTFAITATTTSLTGLSYTAGFVHVFHNGIRLVDGTDYTATNGSTITLTNAAENGDEVVVVSYGTFTPADAYTKAEADDRYVNVTGDTMTGGLTVPSVITSDDTNNYALMAGRFSAGYGGAVVNTSANASFLELQVNGFGGLRTDNAGRVTTPSQPFLLLGTTGYTTANNAALQFNTTYQSRNFSWNTGSHSFTVPVTGVYTFSAATRLQTTALNYIYYRVRVNGANYPWGDMLILQKPNTSDSFQTVNTSFQVYLVASDSVQIQLNYSGTGSYAVHQQSWMSVALLG